MLLPTLSPQLWVAQGFDWGILGIYWSAALTLGGVIYATTKSSKSSKEANAVTFSKTLLERIENLEQKDGEKDAKIDELSAVMSVSLSYIERLLRWGRGGGKPPEPTTPQALKDRLSHLNDHDGGA